MKKFNKNPFKIGKVKNKPQKVIFVCKCRALKDANELRAELNIIVREMGYTNGKDYSNKIEEVNGSSSS